MCLPALHLLGQAGMPLILLGRAWAPDLLAGLDHAGFVQVGQGIGQDARALRSRFPVGRQSRALVFTNSLSSAAMLRLAGVRCAGYRGDGRSLLLNWAFDKPAGQHEVEVFYQLARQALQRWALLPDAPDAAPATLGLPLTAQHEAAAAHALFTAGIDRPFVLLSPTATGLHHGKAKTWPQFGALADTLTREGWLCVTCPPAHEAEQARAAVPAATLLPPLGLGAFAALTRRAALVVCNDSGTSHMAAAAGARQLTLFGVTRRERTGPWSPTATCLGAENAWPSLDEVMHTARGLLMPTTGSATPAPSF